MVGVFGWFLMLVMGVSSVFAQVGSGWPAQQKIPVYESNTWPPILIADRNRTVHAFSSQWLSGSQGHAVRAILYNQWSLGQGWTAPVDILLSPLKSEARVLDAFLDAAGTVHLIFFGGDGTEANVYYSSAPLVEAAQARAWSVPVLVAEKAGDPESGLIYEDGHNSLAVLFSGRQQGNGLYEARSTDDGLTWSKPIVLASTRDRSNFIHSLKMNKGESGRVHVIWNEVNPGGQGRGIFYIQSAPDDSQWTGPILLADTDTGYGTNTPAVAEHNDVTVAFYNLGGVIWQRSSQVGKDWTSPAQLFPRHVGVNGSLSLVVDSDNVLHLFFGQRIPGSPDIHGMWHSILQGTGWSEPEAVVSGPHIADHTGDKAFDPFEARAVVSQGNVLLVTWRSDPGNVGNGVWYSFEVLDTHELPEQSAVTVSPSATPYSLLAETPTSPSPTPEPETSPTQISSNVGPGPGLSTSPVVGLLVGISPVLLLITTVFAFAFLAQRSRH